MTCFPSNSSFLYRVVICALDFLVPNSPKSITSLYAGFFASGKSSILIIVPTLMSTFSNSFQVIMFLASI